MAIPRRQLVWLKEKETLLNYNHNDHNEHAYAGQIEQSYTSKSPKWCSLTAAFWARTASVAEGWSDSVNNWSDSVNIWPDSVNNWSDSVNIWPDSVNNWPDSVNNWPVSLKGGLRCKSSRYWPLGDLAVPTGHRLKCIHGTKCSLK
jgi:hypothetical protein